MKNKILSLALAVVLIAVQLTIPVIASTTEIPEPVFTLDLSEYTAETQTIKNGVTDSATGISAINNVVTDEESGETTTYKPAVKEYISGNDEDVTAVQFATEGETGSTLGLIQVDAETINELLGENGDKEMTVTFWAKPYRNHYGSPFNYSADIKSGSINTWCMKNYFEFKIANGKTKVSVSQLPLNEWTFYAISKTWTESDTTPGNGTWDYTVLFGDTVKTGTSAEVTYSDNSAMNMYLGAAGTKFTDAGQYPFQGEMAGLKVYNSALTQEQLTSLKATENYSVLTTEEELPDSFVQTDITDGAVKTVSTAGRKHVINFDNFIDGDTLSAVTLTDADGNSPEGFAVSKYAGRLFVSYTALKDGKDYTLSITDALKSRNGISATPVSMTLKASSAYTPVFTMDLSEYTADTQTVKNGVTSDATGIYVRNSGEQKPNVKEYYGPSGEKVLALQTANDDATKESTGVGSLGAIEVEKDTINEILGSNKDKEITVTFWAKNYARTQNSGSFVNLAVDNKEDLANASFTSYKTTKHDYFSIGGTKVRQGGNDYAFGPMNTDEWRFFAVSKFWTESDDSAEKGTWTYIVQDGDGVKTGTVENVAYTDTENMSLQIGARIKSDDTPQYALQGEIAGVTVYNQALTQEQLASIKENENYSVLLEEKDLPQTFELVTDIENITISPYAQSLELEFSNIIKASTIKSGIKLYDPMGNEVKTVIVPSGKIAKLTFGDLKDNMTYTLVINDELKSANDIAFEDGVRTSVNTDSAVAELTFGADADNRPTDTNFTFISSGTADDLSDYTVMEEDGVKFIRMGHKGWGETKYSDSFLLYDFVDVQTESFIVDLKIRRGDTPTNATSRVFTANKATGTPVHNMHASNIGTPVTDELGFISMRYHFDYRGDNTWGVTIYDRNTGAVRTKDGVKTQEISGGLKNISMVLWLQKENAEAVQYTDIAEFKIYRKSNWAPNVTVKKYNETTTEYENVYTVNKSGEYTVSMEPKGMATGKYNYDSEDMYAYFVIYETDSNGITLPVQVVGGLMNEDDTFNGTFTLEKQAGCKYTAKCYMWQDNMVPLIEAINYK